MLIVLVNELYQLDAQGCPYCGNNGICVSATQRCVCNSGYYMRDCSASSQDYNSIAPVKSTLIGYFTEVLGIVSSIAEEREIGICIEKLLDDAQFGLYLNATYYSDFVE